MAGEVACTGCGRLPWPTTEPPAWRLEVTTGTTVVALNPCPACGAEPELVPDPHGGATPRVLLWRHQPTCPAAADNPLPDPTQEPEA